MIMEHLRCLKDNQSNSFEVSASYQYQDDCKSTKKLLGHRNLNCSIVQSVAENSLDPTVENHAAASVQM